VSPNAPLGEDAVARGFGFRHESKTDPGVPVLANVAVIVTSGVEYALAHRH
jgi:hypothetical protein